MCSRDGYGKYHLFGCDHNARIDIIYNLKDDTIIDTLENCGGHIP